MAVVGGGVIGLAVAEALARRDHRVILAERGRVAEEATWAAGGMLAPLGEARHPGPFLALALESLSLYPEFVARAEAAWGAPVGFRRCGKLLVAFDHGDAQRLRARWRWQHQEGHDVRLLAPDEAREVEPSISFAVESALHLRADAQVDNRRLGTALVALARGAGVEIREGAPVRGLTARGGRVTGLELASGEHLDADRVVLAAGAWSGGLEGLPRPIPVRPVRGQMLALAVEDPLPAGLVGAPGAYLVPREGVAGPLVVVGASEEDVGFQRGTDAATLGALRTAAVRALPALAAAPVVERWCGFRPGTPDNLPVLGRDPDLPGLVYATGHFRNGILLAPVTADRIARLVTDDEAAGLEAFRPDRFA